MKRLNFYIFPVLIILLFTFGATAQDYDVGQPSELRTLTKVFIGGVGNIENTDKFKKTIKKLKPDNLQIVSKKEDADFVVLFYGNQRRYRTGNSKSSYFVASVTVFLSKTDNGRNRILLNLYGKPDEKKQPTKLAQKFIEEYRKANGII